MENSNILGIFNSIYMFSTLLTVFMLCSAASPVFAEIGNEQLSCMKTHRGMRCTSILQEVTNIARNEQISFQGMEICSNSARGTRCLKAVDRYTITDNSNKAQINSAAFCASSVRGHRSCNVNSMNSTLI